MNTKPSNEEPTDNERKPSNEEPTDNEHQIKQQGTEGQLTLKHATMHPLGIQQPRDNQATIGKGHLQYVTKVARGDALFIGVISLMFTYNFQPEGSFAN